MASALLALEKFQRTQPDVVAIHEIESCTDLTYAQLWQHISVVAAGLAPFIGPGDRVGILVEGGIALPVAWFAVLWCRASVVPLDVNQPPERLQSMIDDCGAQVLLASANEMPALAARRHILPPLVQIVPVESLFAASARATFDPGVYDFASEAHVIYTSGSTGVPKGVRCSHANLDAYCRGKIASHGVDVTARVLLACAATWDPAIGDIASTFLAGATLCVAARATIVHDLANALNRAHVSHVFATPSLWGLVGVAPSGLPALRVVTLGGERVPAPMIATWAAAVTLLNMYGVTEACVGQTVARLTLESPPALVGRPLGEHTIRLEPVGLDDVGEVWITGPGVSPGFLRASPEQIAARFVTDAAGIRWVRSGDAGRWAADGQLEVLGRLPADNQVKLRGFRVQLEGVESAVMQHPLVSCAVAVLVDNPARLVVIVVLSNCTDAAFAAGGQVALMVHCKKLLQFHEIPAQIVRVDAMPLLASGKVDRQCLQASALLNTAGPVLAVGHFPDCTRGARGDESRGEPVYATIVERLVAEAFRRVLELDDLPPPLAHFFELGGSSITAVLFVQVVCDLLADPLRNPTGTAIFAMTPDTRKVRLCALQRKPRVHTYAKFLEWAAVEAPNSTDSKFGARLPDAAGHIAAPPDTLATVLARLDIGAVHDDTGLCSACLHTAADGGHVAVVRALLAAGANPSGTATRTNKRLCPLAQACVKGHTDVVLVLLKAGANPNFNDINFLTSVHFAAACVEPVARVSMLELLLSHGGVVTPRDINRWTPLHHAAWHGHANAVELLLQAAAPIDAKDRWSRTSLSWAVFRGHVPCAKILIDAGALHNAVHAGHRTMPQGAHQRRAVCFLFVADSNVLLFNGQHNHWNSLLQLAIQAVLERDAPLDLMGLIISSDAHSVDAKDTHGGTAVHDAAGAAVLHAIAHQICPDVDPLGEGNSDPATGLGPLVPLLIGEATIPQLQLRATACFSRLVPLLLPERCHLPDKYGATPLDYAIVAANTQAVEELIERWPSAATRLHDPNVFLTARYGAHGAAVIKLKLQS